MSKSGGKTWIKLSGYFGMITPPIAFAFILSAIASAPTFSWADNALSDLGVMRWPTSVIFNAGLVISGILAVIFATGLYMNFGKSVLGRCGVTIFLLCTIALIAIGIFPENMNPMHILASVAFFGLFPISMCVLTSAYFMSGKRKSAIFTITVAAFAALVWILESLFKYVPGVAIPETLSALSASSWAIVIGFILARSGD